MRRSRLSLAVMLLLVGLFWIGQGSGIIGGSVMSGTAFWAAVGVFLVALAIAIVVRESRPASRK